jgi:hypothetical protein
MTLQDIPTLLFEIFIGAVMVFVGWVVLNSLVGGVLDADGVITQFRTIFGLFDWVIVGIAIIFVLVAAWMASTVNVHVGYLPIAILLAVGFIYISSAIKDMFALFINNAAINPAVTTFPNTVILFNNLEIFTAVAETIIIIALFAKSPGRYGGYQGEY